MLKLCYYLLLLYKISSLAQSPRLLDKVWLLKCWYQSYWWNQQGWFEELHTILHWKFSAHGPQKVGSEAVVFGDCVCMQHIVNFTVWFSLLRAKLQ